METKVILHNSISLDCSFIGLTPNMELHYKIVNSYKAEAYMAGSNTAKSGIEMFGQSLQIETEADFLKPNKDKFLSYWVIPDTHGILKGHLHLLRRFEFCRDVIILVSGKTPKNYLKYLDDRQYDYIISGENHADFKNAFEVLAKKYKINTILVDTGSKLGNILLNNDLVNEISLVISPEIIGKSSTNLFEGVNKPITLEGTHSELFKDGYLWITYKLSNS
ncbi:MAG: hypothetical protein A2W99_03490 [Bacteroidetes bacterium GWF2_33_16]|nr:MAG: hypothetical protein A2X00_11580 [Bacteroidetes bacterium GWE2_32_14]OFY08249.1 MAG: hypothetical protein A2W99_03490 [Bacteroidetes bacterium GWF2_33_16]